MSHPVSARLQSGVCFLLRPLPAPLRALLTHRFPSLEGVGRGTGLPCSSRKTKCRFRFSLSAGNVVCPCEGIRQPPDPLLCRFGSSLSASLACSYITTFSESLRALTMPTTLAPHCVRASSYILHSRFECPEMGGIRCPRAIRRFVTLPPYLVGYCRWDGRSGHSKGGEPDNLSCGFMSQVIGIGEATVVRIYEQGAVAYCVEGVGEDVAAHKVLLGQFCGA